MIDYTDREFQGQQVNEKVLCFFRKHWVVLVIPIIIFPVVFVFFPYVFYLLSDYVRTSIVAQVGFLILLFIFFYCLHLFFHRLLNYFLDISIITNYRVIDLKKRLFFQDDKSIIDLHEIQDVQKHQEGILRNILGYGNLIVIVPTMIRPMILQFVPNPDYHFRKVNQAKREYILESRRQKIEGKVEG